MARFHRLAGLTLLCGALMVPLLGVPPAHAAEVLPCMNGTRPYRDLNGDGFEDAVVGDPYATVNGLAEAGTITVLFGEDDQRIGEGERQTLSQEDFGETPEAGDHFGWAVELNITTSGGCYGIIVGSPGEDIDGLNSAGMAHVYTINPASEGPQPAPATAALRPAPSGPTSGTSREDSTSKARGPATADAGAIFADEFNGALAPGWTWILTLRTSLRAIFQASERRSANLSCTQLAENSVGRNKCSVPVSLQKLPTWIGLIHWL